MNIRSIAKRYADAFYDDYKASGEKLPIWQELDELTKLQNTSADFEAVIKNPLVNTEDKMAVFTALHKEGKISDVLFKYISLLIKKGRLVLLESVNDEIKHKLLAEKGEIDAVATFAAPVDKGVKDELEAKLTKVIGKKVNLREEIDPQIIGGVKVKLGSMLYDASVKGQLEKLKVSLV